MNMFARHGDLFFFPWRRTQALLTLSPPPSTRFAPGGTIRRRESRGEDRMKNPDGTLCSEPDNAESFPDWASIGGISIKGSCRAFSRAGRNPGASRAGRTGLRTQAGPSRLISGGGRRTRREVSSKWGKTKKRESRHFPGAPGGTLRRRESRTEDRTKNPDGTLCSEPDNAESFPDWA